MKLLTSLPIIGVTIISSLIIAFTGNAPSASAWSGDLPQCSNVPPSGIDFRTAITSSFPEVNFDQYNSSFIGYAYPTDSATADWAIYWHPDRDALQFYEEDPGTGTEKMFSMPSDSKMAYYTGSTLSYTNTQGIEDRYLVSCYFAYQAGEYQSSWTGAKLNESNPQPNTCDPLDFQCWIGSIFTGIGDGFNVVTRALLQGITFLFVPESGILTSTFDVLLDTFSEKLGFLGYPLTLFIDIINASLVTTTWGPINAGQLYEDDCALPFGQLFGQNIELKFCSVAEEEWWDAMVVIISALTVLTLMYSFWAKFNSIVRHH